MIKKSTIDISSSLSKWDICKHTVLRCLAFISELHQWPVDSLAPYTGLVMLEIIPCHNADFFYLNKLLCNQLSCRRLEMPWLSCDIVILIYQDPLHWRHNRRGSVSNHQTHDCLLSRLFRRRSKKTSKLRATGLCAGNSPVPGEFPAQMASNAENVSIWWRHHAMRTLHFSDTLVQIILSPLFSVDIIGIR